MDYIISFIIKDSNDREACEFYEVAGCAVLGIPHTSSYKLDITGRVLQYTGYANNLEVVILDHKLMYPEGVTHAV